MGFPGTKTRKLVWRICLLAATSSWSLSPAIAQQDLAGVSEPFILAATDIIPNKVGTATPIVPTKYSSAPPEPIKVALTDNVPSESNAPAALLSTASEEQIAKPITVAATDKIPNAPINRPNEEALQSAADVIERACVMARANTSSPDAQKFPLSAPVMFTGRYVGDIDLRVDMEGGGELDAPRLEALMKPLLDETAMSELRTIRGAQNYVPIRSYCDGPIIALFDSSSLELKVEAAISAMESQEISLRHRQPPNPDDFIAPEKFSAGIGALISQTYTLEGENETGFDPLRANFEGYINFEDWLGGTLFFAADALEGENDVFRRREVLFVRDNSEKATRFAIGDINPFIRSFQTSRPLAGISFSRQYSSIQPFRRTVSTGRGQLSLERDSTVEVYVNGVLSERLELRAGNYSLEDFPAAQGVNDVQLRIEDDLGRFIERDFSFFSNSQLLAEGLLDFGFAAGVPRSVSDTGFDYGGSIVASGYVNYGLSDRITLGFNAQTRSNRVQLGSEAVFGTPIGAIGIEASASYFDDAPETLNPPNEYGHAFGLSHRSNFKIGNTPITTNTSAIYQSEFFTGIGEGIPRNQKLVFSTNTTATLPNQYRIGATASLTTDHTGQGNSHRIAITGSKSFENFSINVSANYQSRTFGDDETALLASISIPFGQQSRVRANANTRNRLKALEFARSGRGQVGRLDARVQAIDSDLEQSLNGNLNYWHNRFESRFEFDSARGQGPDSFDQSDISYRFGTFLGYSGGRFGVGRPSPAGFILVDRHKSLRSNPLKVHDSNGQNIEAKSGLFGAALVPVRRPYMPMRLSLDVEGVAQGYDLGTGRLDVLPRWGAGYRVQVGSDASRTILGVLNADDGEPIKLMLGKIVRLGTKEEDPRDFFTNSAGKFVIEGVAPGKYMLRFLDGRSVEVEISDDTEGLVNVGKLEVS